MEGWPDENQGAIYVLNVDGSHLRRVSRFGAQEPAWSRDGNRIAFAGPVRGCIRCAFRVYVSKKDGKGARAIAVGLGPRWSPDGKKLVYSGPFASSLAIVNANGKNPRSLGLGPLAGGGDWSPRGGEIVFMSGGFSNGVYHQQDLYVLDLHGMHVRRLTHMANDSKSGTFNPRWSADGRAIFFVQSRDNEAWEAFYSVNRDGSGLRRLAKVPNEVRAGTANWSLDGRTVVYCNGFGDVVALKLVPGATPRLISRRLTCERLDLHSSLR